MSIESELAKRDKLLAAKSARIRELEAQLEERTCRIIGFDDGVDEGIDGEWHKYSEPQYDLSCGHASQGTEPPNYCPNCGARVIGGRL